MDWKDIVRTVAPTVATALGSPLAGTAVRVLSEVFLGKDDGTEAQIAEAVKNATPEQLLALKKADQDYAIQIKQLDIKLEEAYISDVQDARHTHSSDARVFWLGIAILITFSLIMGAVMFTAHDMLLGGMTIKDPSIVAVVFGLVGTVLGYVASNAQQVVGYFFGSSKGSSDKTEAMAKAVASMGQGK